METGLSIIESTAAVQKINKAAVVGLMSVEGMTAAMARNIITAIAKGVVPNVKVVY